MLKNQNHNTIHIELHVPDFEKAKTFYGRLGFEIVWEKSPHKREGYLVMRRGSSVLCFYCGSEEVYDQSYFKRFPKNTPRGYAAEIIIPVENIDQFYEDILQNGFEENIVNPLELKHWGKKDFRLVDPFGFYLRLTEPYDILEALTTT